METSNLPDAEFKKLVVRMHIEIRERIAELSENFNKQIVNIKTEIKKTF